MKSKWLSFLLVLIFSACSVNPPGGNYKDPSVFQVTVSILPQVWFVEQIAGNLVDVQAMVGPGDDPHTYEPSPKQMAGLAESRLYFTIGVEFEEAWMPRFRDINPEMLIVDSATGVEFLAGRHAENEGESEHSQINEGHDPHIWFSPSRMKQVSINLANALIDLDPGNQKVYQDNLNGLLSRIDEIDSQIKEIMLGITKDHFMVIHPAWAYFAADYDLELIAVEVEGQEPSPEEMAAILNAADFYQVTHLFVQRGSNLITAKAVAREAGISQIIEWDPMAYDWDENMLQIAKDLKMALE